MIQEILRGIVICIMVVMLFSMASDAHAASVGTLNQLGYTFMQQQQNPAGGPYYFQSTPYTHTVTTPGMIISQVTINVPYNIIGETVYFSITLVDGSNHKGTYQYLGARNYTITMDGKTLVGRYEYTTWNAFQQMMGLYRYDQLNINYARSATNPNSFAIYVMSDEYQNVYLNFTNSVILIPLSTPYNDIKTISAMSSSQASLFWIEDNQSYTVQYVQNNEPAAPANSTTNGGNLFNFEQFQQMITDPINKLLGVGKAIIEVFMLFITIGAYLLDPVNDVFILMQFEGLTAVMALSSRGDILKCGAKWLSYNAALFNFSIMAGKGIIQALSMVIQALSLAASAAVQLASMVVQGASAIGGWLAQLAVAAFLLIK